MRRSFAAVAAAALALTACTGGGPGDDPSPSADPLFTESASDTTPDTSSSEVDTPVESAADVDVTTTPDPITDEWAEAVINALLAEYGEAIAATLEIPVVDTTDRLPPEIGEQIRSAFEGEYLERRLAEWQQVANDEDFVRERLRSAEDYTGLRLTDTTIQYAGEECVIALGRVDFSGSAVDGGVDDALSAWSLAPNSSPTRDGVTWAVVDQFTNVDEDLDPLPDEVMTSLDLAGYEGFLTNACAEEDRR